MTQLDNVPPIFIIYAAGNIGALVWLIATVKTDMGWLKRNYDTMYTQSDAAKDFGVRDKEIKRCHERVDEIQKRVYAES